MSPEISHEYLNAGIFASATFPLISSSGTVGLLAIYYEAPHQFRQDEVDLLSMFASQAAISISNAMLHSQTD
ncbi:MAG: GAF domain-containing protein, partial [Aliifodinibius sp.]|nr:GAF domain-containing protein [Candidatus Saccharibacteria bacterium]NIT61577.1 GAF domain-containing protein [Fodinibius sp.]NIV16179.1 GAF domain-containing protein [Fodinibius sp.]NIY30157.1 GAF domain-containing protein [Fodinibius sp.]